jgi:hypothetical protein
LERQVFPTFGTGQVVHLLLAVSFWLLAGAKSQKPTANGQKYKKRWSTPNSTAKRLVPTLASKPTIHFDRHSRTRQTNGPV